MDGWIDGRKNERTDRGMDGGTDGWRGQIDKIHYEENFCYLYN